MRGPAIAFYAPMKPPDHDVPSGDREMARLFLRLLERIGTRPVVASRLRSHGGTADVAAGLIEAASAETARLIEAARRDPPALWFTYHSYYKAPDLIGPAVCLALGIPYVVAEGSRAAPRKAVRWPTGYAAAEAGLDVADLVLVLNPRDRALLEAARPPAQRLVDLPPFIDPQAWPIPSRQPRGSEFSMLAVAMMRPGDKLGSYSLLAEALGRLTIANWRLDIVGDGPAREETAALFASFGARVRLHGLVEDRAALAALYAGSDVLAWPAINEAFGMVFLEAALQGCPAVAGAFGGVAALVRDGVTGLLAAPGDAADFAAKLDRLAADRVLLERLGAGARASAGGEHALARAAERLKTALAPHLDAWVAS